MSRPRMPLAVLVVLLHALLLGAAGAGTAAGQPEAAGGPAVRMAVEVEYHPLFPREAKPGDLFVYVDGDLLAWVPRGGQFAPASPARFARALAPGPHVLRFLAEKHEAGGRGRIEHASRVAADVEVLFRLEAGEDGAIRVRIVEDAAILAKQRGPIDVVVEQGGRTIQSRTQVGRRLTEWPLLCEDVEANLGEGAKVTKKVERTLASCVRWADLWRGVEGAPSRTEVLALLARYGYQPRSYKRYE